MNCKSSMPVKIISFLLAVSVFAIYPFSAFENYGWLVIMILLLQICLVFIINKFFKNFGEYLFFTILLLVSNITNCIMVWIWANGTFEKINAYQLKQGMDMLGLVMAQAACGLCIMLVTIPTVVVILECIISMAVRAGKHSREKNQS